MGCCFQMERKCDFIPLLRGCQFPAENLIKWNGETYCEFHLPLEAKVKWDLGKIDGFNAKIKNFFTAADNRVIDLSGVIFPGFVEFEKTHFPDVSFQGATFSGEANFQGASFSGNAIFFRASFGRHASFEGASFRRLVGFGGAIFSRHARFQGASFSEEASFKGASFRNIAIFYGASFSYYVSFKGATFNDKADFSGMNNDGTDSFSFSAFDDAKFSGGADFSNRTFNKATSFKDATFAVAPKFHNCVLHPDTTFPEQSAFQDTTSPHAADAYRTLKQAMAGIHAHHRQQMFYALEMKSRRSQPETPWMEKLLSRLYEETTDYGQNLLRPLGWLMLLGYGFWLGYFMVNHDHPGAAIGFSVAQVVRPFAVWGGVEPNSFAATLLSQSPGIVLTLATLQSILSSALIILFLLAVRRRFKLQ